MKRRLDYEAPLLSELIAEGVLVVFLIVAAFWYLLTQ